MEAVYGNPRNSYLVPYYDTAEYKLITQTGGKHNAVLCLTQSHRLVWYAQFIFTVAKYN